VHLLHMTDCHAQLLPIYFREPSVNLGVGTMRGQAPASRCRGKPAARAAAMTLANSRRERFMALDILPGAPGMLSGCGRPGRASAADHLLTGEFGSSSNAITSRICCSLRMDAWPKRGMSEQAL